MRPPTAGRLLYLWRASRDAAEPVFRDGEAVLELLTTREMEGLLRRLSSGTALGPAEENPVFDEARFEALWEG